MSQVPFYTVDAFTSRAFRGNPAAVCIFEEEPTDAVKQRLATEFNLSETSFPLVLRRSSAKGVNAFQTESEFSLRWFTPTNEVPLCGHATLATAHVIFNELHNKNKVLHFDTRVSGRVSVQKTDDGRLQMNFPQYEIISLSDSVTEFKKSDNPEWIKTVEQLAKVLVGDAARIVGLAHTVKGGKVIVELDSKTTMDEFMRIQAKTSELTKLYKKPEDQYFGGLIATVAPEDSEKQGFGHGIGYALRFFAPWNGIPEDPATGSAQSAMAPFWHKRLGGRTSFKVVQCYPGRGAEFDVELDNANGRVNIHGRAVTIFGGHFSSEILKEE